MPMVLEWITVDLTFNHNVVNISFSKIDQFDYVAQCVSHSFRKLWVAFLHDFASQSSYGQWGITGQNAHFAYAYF